MTQSQPEVWVVDDDEVNRLLARVHLEMLGWQVRQFTNGHDVLRGLKLALPHAMLIDVRMPGLSGDGLVQQIRTLFPQEQIRLVAYTARSMVDPLQPILESGFDQLLIKPVSFQQMAAALPLAFGARFAS